MKRISKREQRNRFDLIGEVRVHVDSLQRKGARVRVDGVECDLDFAGKARWEITRSEGIGARVDTYPNPSHSGLAPKGTKTVPQDGSTRQRDADRPRLTADGRFGRDQAERMIAFARQHPVGSMANARVLFRRSGDVALEFVGGVRGRLKCGYCCDHERFSKVRWLGLPKAGETVKVVIREYNWRQHEALVSMHDYRKDDRYCIYAAGYRSAYCLSGSPFEPLPWEEAFSASLCHGRVR